MQIQDVRALTTITPSLDQHGFIYRQQKTNVKDFTQRALVEKFYLPEVESILREELQGADRIFFFDWRVRSITLLTLFDAFETTSL
jgi:hypothetical protein